MPTVLWAGFALVIIIVVIVAIVSICEMLFGDPKQPTNRMVAELSQANEKILTELAEMKETLNAVNKMLRDVQ